MTDFLRRSLGMSKDTRSNKALATEGADPCSVSALPDWFVDYDLLEAGHAREYLADAYIQPCQRPKSNYWICCYLLREKKNCFELHLENSDEFLLSALRTEDGDFYLSQYEDYPNRPYNPEKQVAPDGWCGVLEGKDNGFSLRIKGCEHCDRVLEKFSCGISEPHSQVLAEIHHSLKIVQQTGSEVRLIKVNIPPPGSVEPESEPSSAEDDGSSDTSVEGTMSQRRSAEHMPRQFWCPRTRNQAAPKRSSSSKTGFVSSTGFGDAIRLCNRVPEWNEAAGSLVLKFAGGRVQGASAKNFLMYLDDELHLPVDKAVLQFGKQCSGQFSLDFRYPLSLMQAFAICLSVYSWRSEA